MIVNKQLMEHERFERKKVSELTVRELREIVSCQVRETMRKIENEKLSPTKKIFGG